MRVIISDPEFNCRESFKNPFKKPRFITYRNTYYAADKISGDVM
jgi:hypothetical protein